MMKIGIIGSGIVGQVLAKAFHAEGHQVMLGTRTPSKEALQPFITSNPGIAIGLFGEAAAFGELLVLATGGAVTLDAVRLAGLEHFRDKVVIDTTNPISKDAPENGVLKYFSSLDRSLFEDIQALVPEARLVKAFNSVGNAYMYKPVFPGGQPTMFICGNDAAAKKTVTDILTAFGWETADMGMAASARAIEPLCILWCIPGFLHNQWSHAFKLLKA